MPPHPPADPLRRAAHLSSRLTGSVRSATGAPLPGAEVTLLPQDVTTFADHDGGFAFLLPAGRVSLHVAAAGHLAVVVECLDLVPGGRWHREVVLAPEPRAYHLPSHRRDGRGAHRASLR